MCPCWPRSSGRSGEPGVPTTSTSAVARADFSRPARPHDTSRSPPCCCTPLALLARPPLLLRHCPDPAGAPRPVRAHPQRRRAGAHRSPRRRPRPATALVPAPLRRPVRRRLADQLGGRAGHRAARPRGLARCADRRLRRAAGAALGAGGAWPAHPPAAGGQGRDLRAGPRARRRQQRAADTPSACTPTLRR